MESRPRSSWEWILERIVGFYSLLPVLQVVSCCSPTQCRLFLKKGKVRGWDKISHIPGWPQTKWASSHDFEHVSRLPSPSKCWACATRSNLCKYREQNPGFFHAEGRTLPNELHLQLSVYRYLCTEKTILQADIRGICFTAAKLPCRLRSRTAVKF